MRFLADIKVMNNVALGVITVTASTTPGCSLDIKVPVDMKDGLKFVEVELNRSDLLEFLLRTEAALSVTTTFQKDSK